jgi:hypothetical protein
MYVPMFKLMTKKLKNALVNAKMEVFAKMESASAERVTLAPTVNIKMLTRQAFSTTS